jgi:hypothetical protein
MNTLFTILLILSSITGLSPRAMFFDDFNDGDISNWGQRCKYASWLPVAGNVHGSTGTSPCALVPLDCSEFDDVIVSTRANGIHAFGVVARLDDDDNGVMAYISPDSDIARIRAVTAGEVGVTYASMSIALPSGVWYELTFTCSGDQLIFEISIPALEQSWTLQATDPNPHSGVVGLKMGDENGANWDWFSASGPATSLSVNWLTVDDDATGESSGNGNRAFESDEEIELAVKLLNDGTETLTGVSAVLQSLEPDLVLTDNYEQYPNIPAGGTATCYDDFGVTTLSGTGEGTVWPMKLTVLADGGYDTELYFDLALGCGMTDNLEVLPTSWTFTPIESGWLNNWHRSSERNHTTGGGYSLKCGAQGTGDYSDELYCVALSEPFNAPLTSRLQYWQWIDAEVSGSPGFALDGGLVQVGQFGTWYTLAPAGGYPYYIPVGTTGPFDAYDQVFSGTSGWTIRSMNIPANLCGPLQLRYVFGSDASGNREGWHVDDITVDIPTGIEEGGSGQLTAVSLSCSPNPSLGSVTLRVSGPMTEGTVEIYDLSGRIVAVLPFQTSAGQASILWGWSGGNGENLTAGVYFARISGEPESGARLIRLAY